MSSQVKGFITVRSASKRLPRKCFLPFGDETILSHVIKRSIWYGIEPIVCTTTNKEDDEIEKLSIDDDDAPTKAQNQIRNAFNEPIKKSRRVTSGASSTHMPDLASMTGAGKTTRGQDTLNKPFDDDFIINPFKESAEPGPATYDEFLDSKIRQQTKMTHEIQSTLNKLGNSINRSSSKGLIAESQQGHEPSEREDIELEIELDDNGNVIDDV